MQDVEVVRQDAFLLAFGSVEEGEEEVEVEYIEGIE